MLIFGTVRWQFSFQMSDVLIVHPSTVLQPFLMSCILKSAQECGKQNTLCSNAWTFRNKQWWILLYQSCLEGAVLLMWFSKWCWFLPGFQAFNELTLVGTSADWVSATKWLSQIPSLLRLLVSSLLFWHCSRGSAIYELMTSQGIWLSQCRFTNLY